jgi:glycosyltransferase involved in cell wall biosynthesis
MPGDHFKRRMAERFPFSAVLITYNAADQLDACLASLAFADEIVIVDANSTDNSESIARRFNARWITSDWLGFGLQKRIAVKNARFDWVFCVDADERSSEQLAHLIEETLLNPKFTAYDMPRSNFFMGKYLRHGEGFPDWSVRLFDRRAANWSEDAVHEKVICEGPIGRLHCKEGLLHHSADDLTAYLDKQNRYTTLQAQALYDAGEPPRLAQMLLSPVLRFVKFYLIRLGFLDGVAGLVHIAIGCFNSFIKYAKLIALHRQSQ